MPKFRPTSIKELLRVGEVDDEELTTVLMFVLPRGAQLSANEVEYRTSEDEWVLSLRYSEGVVVDAVTGPAYTIAIGDCRFVGHWSTRSTGRPRKFGGRQCSACGVSRVGTGTMMIT